MADRLEWRVYEPGAPDALLQLFPSLVAGYRRENTLTARERAALWPAMLATQLFFVQVFAQERNEEHVQRNLVALTWIHQHRDDIQQTSAGSRRPAHRPARRTPTRGDQPL